MEQNRKEPTTCNPTCGLYKGGNLPDDRPRQREPQAEARRLWRKPATKDHLDSSPGRKERAPGNTSEAGVTLLLAPIERPGPGTTVCSFLPTRNLENQGDDGGPRPVTTTAFDQPMVPSPSQGTPLMAGGDQRLPPPSYRPPLRPR